jgi:hypothetical protein
VPDYSEFPTTPTAWQAIHELPDDDPPPPPPARRGVDPVALVAGIAFCVLAIVLMTGVDVPLGLFRDGGLLWLLLIAAGAALLRRELRKARQKR